MEISTDDWGYLRSLAGGFEEASDYARGEYVQLDRRWLDGVVERLRKMTDRQPSYEAKPRAQRREKRG